MKDFEICRNKDGSFALFDVLTENLIDGVLIKDEGQDPVKVAATAYTERDKKFYVTLPVMRAMLDQAPEVAEERLKRFAEIWERGNISRL